METRPGGHGAAITIKVTPRSKRTAVLGVMADGTIKISVAAPPEDGKANAALLRFLAQKLGVRESQLEIVAGLLKSDANRKLNIAGHTDAKGADDYNLRLSRTRAESVKKQLIALGVPAGQVVTTAMGKAQPLGPNQKADGSDDPEGRSKNRRAEIYLDF